MNGWTNRAKRVGIALSRERLVASMPGGAGAPHVFSRALQGPLEADREWADLRDALAELRDRLVASAPVAHVCLLPPLVQVRRLELPLLREHELRRVLSRDAGRYFVGVREPQVVGAVHLNGRTHSPAPVLAAAAPGGLVELILAAAAETGWQIVSMVPAHAAWHAAARVLWPELVRNGGRLVLMSEGGADLLQVHRDRVLVVRRLYTNGSGPQRIGDALAEMPGGEGPDGTGVSASGAIAIAGPEPLRQLLTASFAAQGISPLPPQKETPLVDSPDLLAATFATRATGPELLPERVHTQRGQRAARRTAMLATLCAALLTMAVGFHLWGLKRELNAVAEQREALRSKVAQVVEIRDAITSVGARLAAFSDAEAGAPQWSGAIADLADYLPRDAYVTAFRTRADTLLIEGVAMQAAGVFHALRQAPRFTNVQPAGPIQQQMREGAPPVERFIIRAQWRPLAPAPAEVVP